MNFCFSGSVYARPEGDGHAQRRHPRAEAGEQEGVRREDAARGAGQQAGEPPHQQPQSQASSLTTLKTTVLLCYSDNGYCDRLIIVTILAQNDRFGN